MDTMETVDAGQEKFPNIPVIRVPVKHANLGIRSHAMDMSTMVELTSFSSLGKIQPFLVTISKTAALLVDLHCHITDKEVCGYLGGHWDINAHNLAITQAFPCRCAGKDKTEASAVEAEIARSMEWKQLTLVGWYHSHPRTHASPSLRDVDSQLDYQIKMKGLSDNSYVPCVGLICSPYNSDNNCAESNFNVFWSLPPSENRPHEYPRPMLLSYSLSQEQFLSQDAIDEIKRCAEFYANEGGIDFKAVFQGNMTYLEKLKNSLASKLPHHQSNGSYWELISGIISPGSETPSSTPSSVIKNSDLFSAVKFPMVTESSVQPTFNASNLFLSPSNFKLDSTVSILKSFNAPSTSKDDSNDNQTSKFELPDLKHKHSSEFTSGELTVSLKHSKPDYDFATTDPSKISTLLSDSPILKNRPRDFPLADISQLSKFSDLSKLTSLSTAELAKLSGFSVDDLTKSSAYSCNLANLFTPLGKAAKDLPEVGKMNELAVLDFKAPELSFKTGSEAVVGKLAEDFSSEHKKFAETADLLKMRSEFSIEEMAGSNVKTEYGGMLDMTLNSKEQSGEGNETMSLSKSHQ